MKRIAEELAATRGLLAELLKESREVREELRRVRGALERDAEMAWEAQALERRDFEYHVGLDYLQEVAVPTVFAEEDGEVLRLDDHEGIANRSSELGISSPRLRSVPADVEASRHPLAALPPMQQPILPSWGDSPLYADYYTGSVPPTPQV